MNWKLLGYLAMIFFWGVVLGYIIGRPTKKEENE